MGGPGEEKQEGEKGEEGRAGGGGRQGVPVLRLFQQVWVRQRLSRRLILAGG